MASYEMVFRVPGKEDQVRSIRGHDLMVGDTFRREGRRWLVTGDEGLSERPGHAARLICEPKR